MAIKRKPKYKEMGDRLKLALESTTLTQKDLAGEPYELGNEVAVNRWFNGHSKPHPGNLIKLCEALNINVHWAKTGEGEMYRKKNYNIDAKSIMISESLLSKEPEGLYVKTSVSALLKMYYEDIELISKLLQNKQQFYGEELRKLS